MLILYKSCNYFNVIYNYAANQFDTFEEPCEFIRVYSIPVRMYVDVINLFRKHNDLLL